MAYYNGKKVITNVLAGGGASTAEKVSYDNTASGLEAVNTQEAIDELSKKGTDYVTTNTKQTISGAKTFDEAIVITNKDFLDQTKQWVISTGTLGELDIFYPHNPNNPMGVLSCLLSLHADGTIKINGVEIAKISDIPSVGVAASKGVVTSIDASDNLPTSNAVKTFVEEKGYVTASGSVASSTNSTKLNNQDASYYLNYNNFNNKPTIPTNTNQLTNGAGYITSASLGTQATFSLSGTTLTITPK